MAWTADDVASLKRAIATGATRVRQGNEEVQFDSLDAMRARLRLIEAEVAGAASSPRVAVIYPRVSRGV